MATKTYVEARQYEKLRDAVGEAGVNIAMTAQVLVWAQNKECPNPDEMIKMAEAFAVNAYNYIEKILEQD